MKFSHHVDLALGTCAPLHKPVTTAFTFRYSESYILKFIQWIIFKDTNLKNINKAVIPLKLIPKTGHRMKLHLNSMTVGICHPFRIQVQSE